MKKILITLLLSLFSITILIADEKKETVSESTNTQGVESGSKTMNDGNYKDAFNIFDKLLQNPNLSGIQCSLCLNKGVTCLQKLNNVEKIDEFIEKNIALHSNKWELLSQAAQIYNKINHNGSMIENKFIRKKWSGEINCSERDRIRSIQLGLKAIELFHKQNYKEVKYKIKKGDTLSQIATAHKVNSNSIINLNQIIDPNVIEEGKIILIPQPYIDKIDVCYRLVAELLYRNGMWGLQIKSDLTQLPDYDKSFNNYRAVPPPVDKNGNPLFFKIPETFEKAQNDGERWRYLISIWEKSNKIDALSYFATCLYSNYNVGTMQGYQFRPENETISHESSPYVVHTLEEDETIAMLANGIRRFKLPEDSNYIKINQALLEIAPIPLKDKFEENLYRIFLNRCQYEKAAQHAENGLKRAFYFSKFKNDFEQGNYNHFVNDMKLMNSVHWWKKLCDIRGNWGTFLPLRTESTQKPISFEFKYRNAGEVHFSVQELNYEKYLEDVKNHLRMNPERIEMSTNIQSFCYSILNPNNQKYLGPQIMQWDEKLTPRKKHFDSTITLSSPIKKAGAYLLTAQVKNGNKSSIIIWVNDLAIIAKDINGKRLYYVTDAINGTPVANANVNFFAYKQVLHSEKGKSQKRRYKIITKEFSLKTNDDGLVYLTPEIIKENGVESFQFLTTVKTEKYRMACLGFNHVYIHNERMQNSEYSNNTHINYFISDRPIYRPEQTVKYKVWINNAMYHVNNPKSHFYNQKFIVTINNPRSEKCYEKNLICDEYGGLNDEFILNQNAPLGEYTVFLTYPNDRQIYAGRFMVEEYKKPEFEVIVELPKEPIKLGDKFKAVINCQYYFGAPVTQGDARIKIKRNPHNIIIYPIRYWDWLYGNGYWWFTPEYRWYPQWDLWGCKTPVLWNRPFNPNSEIVYEKEVKTNSKGLIEVEFDTQLTKLVHNDTDHQYTIIAEVTDASRRTITGQGSVIACRRPFKVFAWVDRGFARANDVIKANFSAYTADQKGVKGNGEVTLFKITYDQQGLPIETPVQKWVLNTAESGLTPDLLINANQCGQYKLSYSLTDSKNNQETGGIIYNVYGENFDSKSYLFNDLELLCDKAEYLPGENVNLMINSNQINATVLLFVRTTNGVSNEPKIIKLQGKSTIIPIPVEVKDMPNFFIEALTISNNKVHKITKEIIVPPQKRVLNIEVLPDQPKYKPGAMSEIKVKITDLQGNPVKGSTVVTVYDKAVEYISGDSQIQDIRKAFWSWKRYYNEFYITSNLENYFSTILEKFHLPMPRLGIFGDTEINDGVRVFKRYDNNAPLACAVDAEMVTSGMAPMRAESKSLNLKKPNASMPISNGGGSEQQAITNQPVIRKNFADTAHWSANLIPDQNGVVTINVPMPENLTTWKIKVWSLANETCVGEGSSEIITTKDLIIRLQSPRFFTEGDEVVLSANIHNYLDTEQKVQASLELEGNVLTILKDVKTSDNHYLNPVISIPSKGEKRIDWRVKAIKEGKATIRMKAITEKESDAMQMDFPVYIHGMSKQVAFSGNILPDQETSIIKMQIPEDRRINDSVLELRVSPSLACTMIDALPYLASYPYGCTEQTLNKFLPTVITQKILKDMNINLKDIQNKRINLNAQELGNDIERIKQRYQYLNIVGYDQQGKPQWDNTPIFSEETVNKMVLTGLARLESMQCNDGGWGWFSGAGEFSSPHTTAVVVHGLQIAQQAGVQVDPNILNQGINWLKIYQEKQVEKLSKMQDKGPIKSHADNLDAMIYMILNDSDVKNNQMCEFIYRDRTQLSLYAQAMFGIALAKQKDQEKLKMILTNIEQYLVYDSENQTAYLNMGNDYCWWSWYGSQIETHAYYLKLLSITQPQQIKTSGIVKYLLNNRKNGSYWNSTRDTALCVEAFADYIKATNEDNPNLKIQVYLDQKMIKELSINAENLFTFDNKIVIKGDAIESGEHQLKIVKQGKGPLYFNAYLSYFSTEKWISKAGLEVKVNRQYYKLIPEDKEENIPGHHGQVVQQKVEKYKRILLNNNDTLSSGDLVEVELIVESKNDYEYILIEDFKAAGFEPVEVRSGYRGDNLRAYVEYKDEKVCFFVQALPQGKKSISYRLRAEIPGRFSALPAVGVGMYAPELKTNSDEIKLEIIDK